MASIVCANSTRWRARRMTWATIPRSGANRKASPSHSAFSSSPSPTSTSRIRPSRSGMVSSLSSAARARYPSSRFQTHRPRRGRVLLNARFHSTSRLCILRSITGVRRVVAGEKHEGRSIPRAAFMLRAWEYIPSRRVATTGLYCGCRVRGRASGSLGRKC